MKRFIPFIVFSAVMASASHAVELLTWEKMPLPVSLVVGQERVIFLDRSIRVGVPVALAERLRVQSAGGVLYLRANAPIETTRLQVQDANTAALILLDITAKAPQSDQPPLEAIRIVDGTRAARNPEARGAQSAESAQAPSPTPIPIVLTRYAAQNLYAPLRTIEPVAGIAPVPFRPTLALDTLLPTLPVNARTLAAWRLEDYWVTAVKLTNTQRRWIDLDPRLLQGDFIAATFQHPELGPAGDSTDTTVIYLVTRGSGLADALLPAISAIDASLNLPSAKGAGNDHGHQE